MDADRFRQADRLLQLTLSQPAGERDAFLRRSCAGDEALEREVRSLLASHDQAAEFLERPAMDIAAESLARGWSPSGDLTGQTIAHYRVIGKLGGGGMGVVYKAADTRLERLVALKFLTDEFARDPQALRRFQREARAASALNHPNICTIYDIGEHDGRPFLVMEYLEGATLREFVGGRPLETRLLRRLAGEIAAALEVAHQAGIVHRDIKPANLFVTRGGSVKILDFGLARQASDATLTQAGMAVGTPLYMPPEQARGLPSDARADLYAFGLVLYEMATGRKPSAGVNLDALAPGLRRVVRKCLEPDRGRRYRNASELRGDLQRLRLWQGIAGPGRWAAAAAVLAVAGGAYFYRGHPARTAAKATRAPVESAARPPSAPAPSTAGVPAVRVASQKMAAVPLRRAETAGSASAPPATSKVNPQDGLTYIRIPPGKFLMGCSPGDSWCDSSEQPAHQVTLTKGFWLGSTEVTQAAFLRVMGQNPSAANAPELPVDSVRWGQAFNYCKAAGMRLPTEAEWEYAARGGAGAARDGSLSDMAWWSGNSERHTHPVARKQPNAFGLFDMFGNVTEWTADWFGPYSAGEAVDPRGPDTGEMRVVRGGSWRGPSNVMRASSRAARRPMIVGDYLGFRCAGD